jgi:hypothetical protein
MMREFYPPHPARYTCAMATLEALRATVALVAAPVCGCGALAPRAGLRLPGAAALDAALDGGLRGGRVYEFAGLAGSGKTQVCCRGPLFGVC